ncbi:hypothetical protein KJ903_03520, partial [Patescibacteria group bacterium]|nr:hypothetical protein [Patescibacteria group bacterium]
PPTGPQPQVTTARGNGSRPTLALVHSDPAPAAPPVTPPPIPVDVAPPEPRPNRLLRAAAPLGRIRAPLWVLILAVLAGGIYWLGFTGDSKPDYVGPPIEELVVSDTMERLQITWSGDYYNEVVIFCSDGQRKGQVSGRVVLNKADFPGCTALNWHSSRTDKWAPIGPKVLSGALLYQFESGAYAVRLPWAK